MQTIDLLLLPRYLVPMTPGTPVLADHAVAVDGGRVVGVMATAEARARYAPREWRELPEHALMPGLVNLHTHMAMSLMRGFADDLPLMTWLHDHIWPAEAAHVSAAFCADGIRLAAAEMIRGGVTCVNDMYFYPEHSAQVLCDIGLRGKVGLPVFDFPTPGGSPEDYFSNGIAVARALADNPLVGAIWAPHAPYSVGDRALRRVRELADELDIGIHMHIHETGTEVVDALRESGQRPLQRLGELGLLGPDLVAVHMTQLTDAEIAEVAAHGVHVAHCPESNLKLASGFCPVQKLLDAGVNVGIGTDGAASNNDLDLFGELRTASLLAKAVAHSATALPAARALELATLGGARALGLDGITGSIEVGKAADIIAVDLSGPHCQPVYHVLSQLAYACHSRDVSDVWVNGRQLLRNGQLTTLDRDAVLARTAEWRHKLMP